MLKKALGIGTLCFLGAFSSIRVNEAFDSPRNIRVEYVSDAIDRELVDRAIDLANETFPRDLAFNLVFGGLETGIAGKAYPFGRKFDFDNYSGNQNLSRIHTVELNSELFKKEEFKENLWDSLYLKNPSKEELYKRAILHELGHLVYSEVKHDDLERKLYQIDIDNSISGNGSRTNHPAHPSFYSFFYAGGPIDVDRELQRENANETFAEIYALSIMGKLNDVSDPLLKEKMDLVFKALGRE